MNDGIMPTHACIPGVFDSTSEHEMTDTTIPSAIRMIDLLSGSFVAQAIYVAAKLGLADHVAAGTVSPEALARELGVDVTALSRLMRLLVAHGVFRRDETGEYENTPLSTTLLSSGEDSLRDLAMWWCEEPHWRVYGHLLDSIRDGRCAWPMVHGTGLFPYLMEDNPALGELFNRAMTSFSRTTIPAVLAAYDFSRSGVVADLGGGNGHLLAAVLAANTEARGILFDLPPAVAGAPDLLEDAGVAGRSRIVTGDFFEPLPFTADTFLIKHILHDWPDDECVRMLRRVREATSEHGRVLVLEMVIPESDGPHFSKVCDIEMLVSAGGRERDMAEFGRLLSAAGLKVARVIPTASVVSIIEAVPEQACE